MYSLSGGTHFLTFLTLFLFSYHQYQKMLQNSSLHHTLFTSQNIFNLAFIRVVHHGGMMSKALCARK